MSIDLLPKKALAEVIRAYEIGAKKYAKDDWRTRYDDDELYLKYKRHLAAWRCGAERYDKYDGQHHLAACIFHLMAMLEKDLENEQSSNRP